MQASLYVRRGPSSGQVFTLAGDRAVLIGRNVSNHIVLLDREVSANHCVLVPNRKGSGFVLIDARSRHGTLVNGKPHSRGGLDLGDIIQVGPFELEFSPPLPRRTVALGGRPCASRPAAFELVPRGWRATAVALPPASVTLIGRGPCADIAIDDTFASAYHCLICLDPTDDCRMPFVVDLRSSNGTYINNRPVHRKHLLPGESIVLGQARLKLRRARPAEAALEADVEIPPERPRSRVGSTQALPPEEAVELSRPHAPEVVEARDTIAPSTGPAVAAPIVAPQPREAPPPPEPAEEPVEHAELVPIDDEPQAPREAIAEPQPDEEPVEQADVVPVGQEPEPPAEPEGPGLEDILAPVEMPEGEASAEGLDLSGLDDASEEAPEAPLVEEAPDEEHAESQDHKAAPEVSDLAAGVMGKETVAFEPIDSQVQGVEREPEEAQEAKEPQEPEAVVEAGNEPAEPEGEVPEPVAPAPEQAGAETVELPALPREPEEPQPLAAPRVQQATTELLVDGALSILPIGLEETRILEPPPAALSHTAPVPPAHLLAAAPDDYDEFFGFRESPFQLKADPDWFFDSQRHWDALDTLVHWLRTGPPVAVLFGEEGIGKSMLVECLAQRLGYRRPAAVVVRASLEEVTLDGLLGTATAAARELHPDLPDEAADPLAHWHQVTEALQARRTLVAFLVDGTRPLRDEHVENLAPLVQSPSAAAVVRLLLSGDESVRELVTAPPLSTHLGVSCYLAPMDVDEVAGYVAHRLLTASGERTIPFTRRGLELIAEFSGGVPRTINVVADAALRRAFREDSAQVSHAIVARAIAEDMRPGATPRRS